MKLRNIEILEKSSNKKGDLFGRLMSDLLHTLGYDEPRLNIHKAGREIDLTAIHRTEQKIMIGECKAHVDKIGGSDINKFVGVIDAEVRKIKKDPLKNNNSLVGYFISLSGFKETALEQENEIGNDRVILIGPQKIVDELIRGRILVAIENAINSLSSLSNGLNLMDYVDLLAHENGWVWVFYYSNSEGQKVSHVAFVHAEGKPLIKELADGVLELDNKLNKLFKGLTLINSTESTKPSKKNLVETSKKYFKYLENELGDIHFEGMPTDKEAGSVKVKLENIFVPLHLTKNVDGMRRGQLDIDMSVPESLGEILKQNSRLAVLAKPGGGKSTLLKRIAIAYAFPERRKQINDSLPDKNWFPIFLRCRELGDKVTHSITEIINNIPIRAEIPACAEDFSILVSEALQNGNALLLVDGLDEISEDKNRIIFANQLRTFIATYPNLNIIVTSREAGFRVVAGSLASYCENFTVSSLTDDEIVELCLKWHKAIIDESENTLKEAQKLSELILRDLRIKVLAENPLLLTTLLFVKRWAGYLPTKRSVLYQEMIKLLLVTWNVEGHDILDIEEAEPQLAYVAYWMSKNGHQTISAEELNKCLIDAKREMPEILGYTTVNPSEFIKRVESRSSLLIMTGHKRLGSGNLTAIYEFLHLSFQEYLTAKAIVKGYLPQSDSSVNVLHIIEPHINKESWKEIIPLIAVLLERDTKNLIEYLISESKTIALAKVGKEIVSRDSLIPSLLGSCLANEIQINPELLEIAIEWYSKNNSSVQDKTYIDLILKTKFASTYRKRVKQCFFEEYDDKFIAPLGSSLADVFLSDLVSPYDLKYVSQEVLSALKNGDREEKCMAILGLMGFSFGACILFEIDKSDDIYIEEIFTILLDLLEKDDIHLQLSICWCIVWVWDAGFFPKNLLSSYVPILIKLWMLPSPHKHQRMISWALSKILVPSLSKNLIPENAKSILWEKLNNPENEFDKLTSIFIGTILGEKFDNKEMTDILKSAVRKNSKTGNTSISLFAKKLRIKLDQQEELTSTL